MLKAALPACATTSPPRKVIEGYEGLEEQVWSYTLIHSYVHKRRPCVHDTNLQPLLLEGDNRLSIYHWKASVSCACTPNKFDYQILYNIH